MPSSEDVDALPREVRVHGPAAARGTADAAARRDDARGDGIFAELRDSVYFADRCRHCELVRNRGVAIASSGDLVQRFEAAWDADALKTHREAAAALYRVKDRTFETIARRLRDGEAMTEFAIQQLMVSWFEEERLISDSPPVVAAQENAGDPMPAGRRTRAIGHDELVLLDLWRRGRTTARGFADIMGGFAAPGARRDGRGVRCRGEL
jgi:Xaa-Pro aminopeptidase